MVCVIKNLNLFIRSVYNALLDFKEQKIDYTNRSFSPHVFFVIETISAIWPPLKRDSMKSSFLPWNLHGSSETCIQFFFAFVLKIFFALSANDKLNQSKSFDLINDLFDNNQFCVFFWQSIKLNMSDQKFVKKHLKSNIPHVLCIPDTFFHTRTNANQELEIFETYLNHLTNHGNGLIVFSQQRLFSANSTLFIPSLYSIDKLKTIKTVHSALSIEDVFEPPVFSQNSQNKEIDFESGAFDRLLELLSIGQDFVFSIDSEFSKLTH